MFDALLDLARLRRYHELPADEVAAAARSAVAGGISHPAIAAMTTADEPGADPDSLLADVLAIFGLTDIDAHVRHAEQMAICAAMNHGKLDPRSGADYLWLLHADAGEPPDGHLAEFATLAARANHAPDDTEVDGEILALARRVADEELLILMAFPDDGEVFAGFGDLLRSWLQMGGPPSGFILVQTGELDVQGELLVELVNEARDDRETRFALPRLMLAIDAGGEAANHHFQADIFAVGVLDGSTIYAIGPAALLRGMAAEMPDPVLGQLHSYLAHVYYSVLNEGAG